MIDGGCEGTAPAHKDSVVIKKDRAASYLHSFTAYENFLVE